MWWLHAAVDVCLVGYLVYLRRQVRMEEAIRNRRAARMAGTRRQQAADDPELDEWARRGRDATSAAAEPGTDRDLDADADLEDGAGDLEPERPGEDDLEREVPERVTGTGEPVWARAPSGDGLPDPVDNAPALPRLKPAPTPPLPEGTSLVEVDEEDPDLHDLAGPPDPTTAVRRVNERLIVFSTPAGNGGHRGCGAIGSASRSHREGQGFDSPQLHRTMKPRSTTWAFILCRVCEPRSWGQGGGQRHRLRGREQTRSLLSVMVSRGVRRRTRHRGRFPLSVPVAVIVRR